ncbi:MAG: hypothetical protein FJ191_10360 [Gammaproteobacteria bacterium]|nr:hypothetical protein [Gammaproteobacteria bacterium]
MSPLLPDATHRSQGLLLGLLLGIGSLALAVWWTLRDLAIALANNKVTASLIHGQVLGPVVTQRLLEFALALVALHLAAGLIAWTLARLTLATVPRSARLGPRWLVIAWFAVLAALVWVCNASWYPGSRFAPELSWLSADWYGWRWAHLALVLVCGGSGLLLVRTITTSGRNRRIAALLPVALIVPGLAGLTIWYDTGSARPAAAFDRPHVVILGLDSLRDDLGEGQSEDRLTPHVDGFVQGAHRFTDTISPLARTYPALVSILTGRHPVVTNARFNLMPRALVSEGETLGDALRAAGYHSVYATDEVRFANLDPSFGFDQLITPPVGASDFLLGKAGDLPLVNLLSATRLGAWLFPTNHANRAAHVTYRPDDFTARLRREIRVDRPGFLMIHLTLAHWPYNWAGHRQPTTPQEYRPAYQQAIREVDRQFDAVLRLLAAQGVLDNAIVVVLSDHGEALGWPGDSMLRRTGQPQEIWNTLWGHGTSVLSPHQYSVFLALRGFGRAALPGTPGHHDWPVSLEDVRPTLQEAATGTAPEDSTGISLLPLLDGRRPPDELSARIRYTETDFNTPMVLTGKYNESGLVHEGAAYYEIVPATGWMQLKTGRLPELMFRKERAAVSRNSLLAAVPSADSHSVSYLFTDRRAPLPRRLAGRPDPAAEPEAARLWDALHERFGGGDSRRRPRPRICDRRHPEPRPVVGASSLI